MINMFDEQSSFFYENGFYLTSAPYRLGNMIAHYELYKKILDLPGDVIELGVFKGGGIIQFATFRELLENSNSRKIVGFDVFGEFPGSSMLNSDKSFVDGWNKQFKDEFLSKEEIYESFKLKGFSNIELVKGDISDTIDEYLLKNPQTKISLLHIDVDVYEPTKTGLEKLFDRVVRGGVIVFDDYAAVEGATLAIDEFFQSTDYVLHKYSFSHKKPSYIIKK